MSKYVDVDEVMKEAEANSEACCGMADLTDIKNILSDTPAADVAPVIHAHWVHSDNFYPYCSHCSRIPTHYVCSDYCMNCGAKMDEDTENRRRVD